MKTLLAPLMAVTAVFGAPTALAAHPAPPAGVYVDNDSGMEVDVYVDGAWRGSVRASDERTFSTLPGNRQVSVRAHGSSLVLFDGRVALSPARSTSVLVPAPRSHLTLINDGPAPLYVDISSTREDFWLLPGGRRTVDVSAGPTLVTTSMYSQRGMLPVTSYDLRLAPGSSVAQGIGHLPPPPTSHVAFTNYESTVLRVYVAGVEIAVIPPRSTREVNVDAGRHMVTVAQQEGRILYNAPVTFQANSAHTVEVRGGIRVASTQVARDDRDDRDHDRPDDRDHGYAWSGYGRR